MNLDFLISQASAIAEKNLPENKARQWTNKELDFLDNNIGKMNHAEIGEALGRSEAAVKIIQIRKGMPAPSKRPGWMSGNDVAKLLGVDIHTVMRWADSGLMSFDVIPGVRRILNIREITVWCWAVNWRHWIYFKAEKVSDRKLQSLVHLSKKRWGDEWLTIGQAAVVAGIGYDRHTLLNNRVNKGQIPEARWNGNWYIPRSAAVRLRGTIFLGKGGNKKAPLVVTRADGWILKAVNELGLTHVETARRMHNPRWTTKSVAHRLKRLREK